MWSKKIGTDESMYRMKSHEQRSQGVMQDVYPSPLLNWGVGRGASRCKKQEGLIERKIN